MRLMMVALIAVALAGCAAPTEPVTDTLYETLQPGEYLYEEFEIVDEGALVEIDLDVTGGPRVNFYVIEPGQLDEYERGESFQVVDGQRAEQVTHYHDIIEFPAPGIYYLLFDNYVDATTPAEETSLITYTLSYDQVIE